MVHCWELTQGHGKTQINTIEICKVLLALLQSKLNVPCMPTASFCTCVSVTACSQSIWAGR